MNKTLPYGRWPSPIGADLIAAGVIRLGQVAAASGKTWWSEGHADQGGRRDLVCADADGTIHSVLPKPYDARTRVHEYGGGAFTVHGDDVYFTHFADQQLYQLNGEEVTPLTQEPGCRFAAAVVDEARGRLICICEDHRGEGQPSNKLVAVKLSDGSVSVVAEGNDFYAAPRLSPCGKQLAWVTWNHPNMPWEKSWLVLADFDETGKPINQRILAGGSDESVMEPRWSPQGDLVFVSDRDGWWNLYRYQQGEVTALLPMEAEFGAPAWNLERSYFGFAPDGDLICAWSKDGTNQLGRLDMNSGQLRTLDVPFTQICQVRLDGHRLVFRGGGAREADGVISMDLNSGDYTVLRRSFEVAPEVVACFSEPQAVSFETTDGELAHGLLYLPYNPNVRAQPHEKPPLIVSCHGGPTAMANGMLSLGTQYWTSRGFAVFDLNYGGSVGYGRAYRQRLDGQWGIVDVADCANGARHLVNQGLVDEGRVIVRGGSAGGYTTLMCLATTDAFSAGSVYFGVSDLEALVRDTHKFESQYLESLVGPYPAARDLYLKRSPVHLADGINTPTLFFQGDLDPVVPLNQTEAMAAILREKGVEVRCVIYEGERHGFLKAENIIHSLETELAFYVDLFKIGA